MNKSPDAFRTISEVADDLDIPQHVLRFWETRFTSIRPLKRGGGRRYYRPDDVELLKGIRQLLYGQGYTIKGVQRILKEGGPRAVQEIGRGEHVGLPAWTAPGEWDREDSEEASLDEFDTGRPVPAEAAEWRSPPAAPPPVHEAGYESREPAVPVPRSGASLDRQRLRAALDELLECRRILAGLRR